MSTIAYHLNRQGPGNPFPGVRAMERRLGRSIEHQLGSNEGLDMPHSALGERFGAELVALARCYGDAEGFNVRKRLVAQLGTPLDTLLIDAGADGLLALCLRALCDTGVSVVASAGTYPAFSYFAEGQGCHLVEVPYQSGPGRLAPDLDALVAAAQRHDARVVYLANPDNPSGHYYEDEVIHGFLDALPGGCTLVLDEAYHDFRPEHTDSNPVDGMIRVRTFSKAHGLAGLRIGYAIAVPAMIQVLEKVRIHYAVSSLALAAAETVLDHDEEVRGHVRDVIERRERLAEHLRSRGAEVLPSAANFIAVRLSDANTAGEVYQNMLRAGIAIHRPAHPDLANVLRISAVEDALVPGRLAEIENVLRDGG